MEVTRPVEGFVSEAENGGIEAALEAVLGGVAQEDWFGDCLDEVLGLAGAC